MTTRRFLGVLGALAIMGAVMALDWWLFKRYMHTNYFLWYLKNGSLISIAVSFMALVWEGLEMRQQLLSAHPARYLAGCFGLLGTFYLSISIYLEGPRVGKDKDISLASALASLWDMFVTIVVLLAVTAFTLAWLVVVAPLNYFVTLVTGALARQQLRGPSRRVIVAETEKEVQIITQPAEREVPRGAVDVSFARKPFVVTQAITSLALWVGNTVYVALR